MTSAGIGPVGYAEAARRHFSDASFLDSHNRKPNAGQLFGIAAECGLKAIAIGCGLKTESDGTIKNPVGTRGRGFKDHMPDLHNALIQFGHLLPDGRSSSRYLAMMPNLTGLSDWAIEQRYWSEVACPVASLSRWQLAANEVMVAIDAAQQDGVI